MNPRNLQKILITISVDMSAKIQETMRARMLFKILLHVVLKILDIQQASMAIQ